MDKKSEFVIKSSLLHGRTSNSLHLFKSKFSLQAITCIPNALLTPHIGYVTAENYNIFYNQMIEALEACVNGKPIRVIE